MRRAILFRGPLVLSAALAWPLSVQPATPLTQSFEVRVTIVSECTVFTPADLNFGTNLTSNITAPIYAQTAIQVTCSPATPFEIALNGGTYGTLADRRMRYNTNELSYQLHTTETRNIVWGDGTGGTQTVGGTGTGVAQTVPVFGTLAVPSIAPPPGTYVDTITATLTY